jgi:hypothetical protein
MIDDVHLLYPGAAPNLCSSEVINALRHVRWSEAWVRYSALFLGSALFIGLAYMILPTLLPRPYLRLLHMRPGHFTTVGLIFVAGLFALAAFFLNFYFRLRTDIGPYSLPSETLCRYKIRTGRITGFGVWASFGDRWSRYERIRWTIDEAALTGTTPYVRALLSVWLDYDDPVYVGVDPDGRKPPIFLGVAKPAPQILLHQPEANWRMVYSALEELFKTSRRWKGTKLLRMWGAAPHKDERR